ncbi:MAG TPA: sigma-70 family RNA polymerase sigma factor [Gaiellaceae bacterium]|nr:sigma-70 family RNA polymerase sigma factor [Gaiellaceae bacterium]
MRGHRDPLADPKPLIPRLYRYCAYMLGDGADAEDVASETWERALRYRSSYDPRKGAPLTWLIAIAAGCIRDRNAATARRPLVLTGDAEERADAGDLAEEAALRVTVQKVVDGLGERERELVALRYGAGLTARQIGELLGLRTNAAEVALHRLNARLREALAAEDPPAGSAARKGLDLVTDI